MSKRNPQQMKRLRLAVRHLLQHEEMIPGMQSRLAAYFRVSRQRVHQIVVEERQSMTNGT